MNNILKIMLTVVWALGQFSCAEKTNETTENQADTTQNLTETISQIKEANPIGENNTERPEPVQAQEDTDGFIRFSANGTDIHCNYIAKDLNPKASSFEYKADKSFAVLLIERGSEEKMKEKIVLKALHFDLQSLTFPAKIAPQKPTQSITLIYSVRQNGKYENYYAHEFDWVIDSFRDNILEGNFTAKALNQENGKEINLENGTFKIRLETSEIE